MRFRVLQAVWGSFSLFSSDEYETKLGIREWNDTFLELEEM